ncbi:capsule assembly Wzi family protein [Dyadobacter sp. CY261]|uniref:capsule assembly Wzi family protein n=1 Tax=Dyadobacter sp. CY261 TaxID=2907203 RepID=UPI001F38B47C|nr:capsule assembly Wzi family protein [Dyadobacter sp. CY261]MCF0073338.1 capsule assembly Wzi family protein [Dyadobacter sp. CY261]
MRKVFTFSVAIVLAIVSGPLLAQKNHVVSNLEASVEAGAYLSSNGETPFWLTTNQFGMVPDRATAGFVQATAHRKYVFYDSLSNRPRKFDWSAGVSPVGFFNKDERFQFVLPEAHASVRFKSVELYAGRRREVMGLGDTTLSSGFYSMSGNSLPIPKIQIGTVGFTPLKFTRNFVAVHAGFAHGWFNADYIKGVRLHQKFVYLRLGKSKNKFYLGLNHNVMWAGHSDYLKQHPDLAVNGELPSSWSIYPNVVFAFTSKNWFEKNGYGAFDSYRVGNHLGSYDVAFETKLSSYKLFIYHQHPFEDVSSMLFKNIPDGLYGVNFKLNPGSATGGFAITHLTLEFLSTKNQSGSEFYIPGSTYQGADNYFNHSQYTEGWSYQGKTVGTPFIIPGKDMDRSKLRNDRYFPDNRVNVWYIGTQGKIGKALALTLRVSYSQNFGTPGAVIDPPKGQFSSVLGAQYRVPGLKTTSILARIATDQGDIFTRRTGGYIGIRKDW